MMLGAIFQQSFQEAAACLHSFVTDEAAQAALVELADKLVASYEAGGKVLIAGNGGSMADAMHFAEELTGRFRGERIPLPAIAMADPTHTTCVANDYGFEFVFSRMIQAFGKPEDVVILLSTSGNSPNVLRAARTARESGIYVAGFLGKGGGALAALCDLTVLAPGQTSDRIQEIHMLSLHILIEALEVGLKLA